MNVVRGTIWRLWEQACRQDPSGADRLKQNSISVEIEELLLTTGKPANIHDV